MEKYGILLLIIVYAISLGITGVLFYPDTMQVSTTTLGVGSGTFGTQTTWAQMSTSYKFLSGALGLTFPGVPAEVNAVLFVPYILLIIMFIYYNLPKTVVISTPEP